LRNYKPGTRQYNTIWDDYLAHIPDGDELALAHDRQTS
jgi:hypothetical protein